MLKINVNAMNKVELYELHNQVSDVVFAESREHKAKFIEENQNEWKEIGSRYKGWREAHGYSKTEIAKQLGVSTNKLTKFENGDPITNPKLMEKAYGNLTDLIRARKLIADMPKNKTLDNPKSWSDSERVEFANILLWWISAEDHTYNLYKFLREVEEGNEVFPFDDEVKEFQKLLHEWLDDVEGYEEHYIREKKEYEKWKKEQMRRANNVLKLAARTH